MLDLSETKSRDLPKPRIGTWIVCAVCLFFGLGILLTSCSAPATPENVPMHTCENHLKKIGVAVYLYTKKYDKFPPAYTVDSEGRRLHSWRTLLLPFLEGENQERLYKKIRLDEPWNSPHNWALLEKTTIDSYHCPEDKESDPRSTSYVRIIGSEMLTDGDSTIAFDDLTRRLSQTIFAVEMSDSGIHWAEPRDLRAETISFKINDKAWPGIRSMHPDGANLLFCNGMIYKMAEDTDPAKIKAQAKR